MIAAEGEQKASRALREASEVIAESSSALQLRYLQVPLLKCAFIFCCVQEMKAHFAVNLVVSKLASFLVYSLGSEFGGKFHF